jgi:hypothetical protein
MGSDADADVDEVDVDEDEDDVDWAGGTNSASPTGTSPYTTFESSIASSGSSWSLMMNGTPTASRDGAKTGTVKNTTRNQNT